ncbi:MAG TPA: hypothetical protein VIO14_09245, partial [Dehalococcoidia bacterium]
AADEEGGAADAADRVRVLGYEIAALLEVHFRKENDIYLELLDRHGDPHQVQRLMGTARAAGHHHG